MPILRTLVSLLVLTFIAGCGSSKTEDEQTAKNQNSAQDANVSALSTPFEALASHPRFELSNLQFPSENSFTVQWRVTSGHADGTWALAVVPGGNSWPTSVSVNVFDDRTSGEVSGTLQSFGGMRYEGPPLESACEVFMTVHEAGHTFKISNSFTSGSAATTAAHPASPEIMAQVAELHKPKPQEPPVTHTANQDPPAIQNPSPATPKPTPQRPTRQRPQRVSRPPGMAPVPPTLSVPNGTELMAQKSKDRWVKATVVETRADGYVKVHWEDNGGDPDEFLHRAKLALDPDVYRKLRTNRNR